MRNAPSVVYPVGRCVFYAGFLISWGTLVLVLLAWATRLVSHERVAVGVVFLLIWAVLARMNWLRSPISRLRWDATASRGGDLSQPAGAWSWHSAAYQDGVALLRVERVQDLQRWMLLRLHNRDGAQTWVWVERWRDPDRWNDLRRAVVAHG